MLSENQPREGKAERRKAAALLGVIALNIATRAMRAGITELKEIFQPDEGSSSRIIREKDFNNKVLQDMVGAILDAANLKHHLTPEQTAETLDSLKKRFHSKKGESLHRGVEWARVEASLLANPEALWSIYCMEAQEHEPDVYFSDEEGFDIGTTSQEAPAQSRNCVYDEYAAEWLRKKLPNIQFNGSAMAMAEELGIDMMTPDQYLKRLQKKGKFDLHTMVWLKTDELEVKQGFALVGCYTISGPQVKQCSERFPNDQKSWRGSLRINWV